MRLPFVPVLLLSTSIAAQEHYLTIVFDTSGSMSTPSGNSTRLERAKVFANIDVGDFFAGATSPNARIYHFNGCGIVRLPAGVGWFTDAATAQAAITGFSPAGTTPLYETLCLATTELGAVTVPANRKALCIYSDGVDTCPITCVTGPVQSGTTRIHCENTPATNSTTWYDAGTREANTCALIQAVAQMDFCVYGFASFADDGPGLDPVLRALALANGGRYLQVDDRSSVTPWVLSGTGCRDVGGTQLRMRFFDLPRIGRTVRVGVDTSPLRPSFLSFGFPIGPFDLTGLGAPGCWLSVSPDATVGPIPADTLVDLAIPNDTSLISVSLGIQGLQVHPGNNHLGIATSNRLMMTVAP